eukprot:CAMPEP_0182575534 /NCGR_PEP_ID=MMETSP1324-20130603/30543_1 /TAXON_ID=236786 /ORGANISM="Florenciella sp., Strain RCC1587" /LENGTH=432 /DNA_ID=CAMNT_0024791115 /DNA_START=73 /DNA_END=1368 /DNA_ORIENTATION=+
MATENMYGDLVTSTTRATPKSKRRRKVPPPGKIPLLEEMALLSFFEAHSIKPQHYYTLLRILVNHPDPGSMTWDDIPWDDKSLGLPSKLKDLLPNEFVIMSSKVANRFESTQHDNHTTKLLVELHDGERVEAVVMKYNKHSTVCVSSQVGCQMACSFCATGTMGMIGNLSAGEVLEQLLLANTVAQIRNVVFMGMGEPLNNYNAVISALRQMTDRRVFSLRAGHITVSTVGVVPSMHKLTRDMPSVSLALSLHASNQHVREVIVPTATAYPFEQIMGALDNHLSNCNKKSNTSVAAMIEYILIANINDADEHAVELGTLMRDRNVMINIIPYNYTPGNDFQAPSQEKCDAFQRIVVEHSGRMCRVRRVHGSDIAGACGQLALSMPKKAAAGGGCSDGSGAGDCGGGADGAHRPGVVEGTAAAPVDIEDILGG